MSFLKSNYLFRLAAGFAGRRPVDPVEVYAIGYPKSGTTWARLMLGKYAQEVFQLSDMPLFEGVESDHESFENYPGPNIAFAHRPLVWTDQVADDLTYKNVVAPLKDKRVVLIVRYPLDAMVSSYMQWHHKVGIYKGELSEFVNDRVFGLEKLFRFHRIWSEYHDRCRDFHLLRYEDMIDDAGESLAQLSRFMGWPHSPEIVKTAVDFASFDNLKGLERSSEELTYRTSSLRVFGPRGTTDNGWHIRRGIVGGYHDNYDPDHVKILEKKVSAEMPEMYGYSQPPAAKS